MVQSGAGDHHPIFRWVIEQVDLGVVTRPARTTKRLSKVIRGAWWINFSTNSCPTLPLAQSQDVRLASIMNWRSRMSLA